MNFAWKQFPRAGLAVVSRVPANPAPFKQAYDDDN
jgi:hypothetical protein